MASSLTAAAQQQQAFFYVIWSDTYKHTHTAYFSQDAVNCNKIVAEIIIMYLAILTIHLIKFIKFKTKKNAIESVDLYGEMWEIVIFLFVNLFSKNIFKIRSKFISNDNFFRNFSTMKRWGTYKNSTNALMHCWSTEIRFVNLVSYKCLPDAHMNKIWKWSLGVWVDDALTDKTIFNPLPASNMNRYFHDHRHKSWSACCSLC